MTGLWDIETKMRMLDEEGIADSVSRDVLGVFIQDMMNRKDGIVEPDTTAADKFFVDGFLTYSMYQDFWEIVKAFLKEHYCNVEKFSQLSIYVDDRPEQSDPEKALKIRFLGIMYEAAKSGDEYSISLFKFIYKTYHKQEYKQLKRFKKLSASEIFSLAEDEEGGVDYHTMARILGMSRFYGIQLEEKISALYLIIEKVRKDWEMDTVEPHVCFPDGLYQECVEQVEKWIEEERNARKYSFEFARHYEKIDQFSANCLDRLGYPSDFVYRSNGELEPIDRVFAVTLALLRITYPGKEFSYEEVQEFAHIYQVISALVSVCDMYDDSIEALLRKQQWKDEFPEEKSLFNPESIIVKKEIAKPKDTINKTVVVEKETSVSESQYMEEIIELRRKLREKEQESRYFKEKYDQVQMSLKELQTHLKKYEADRDELIALRNHVYRLSEEYEPMDDIAIKEMMQAIAKRKIIIIGGHTNWINKLKKEFPNWKFFDAGVTRLNETMVLDGAEKVYFFTNHISHGTYGKYISLVRENKIPFGYLQNVNMENVIKQIYKDFLYEEKSR